MIEQLKKVLNTENELRETLIKAVENDDRERGYITEETKSVLIESLEDLEIKFSSELLEIIEEETNIEVNMDMLDFINEKGTEGFIIGEIFEYDEYPDDILVLDGCTSLAFYIDNTVYLLTHDEDEDLTYINVYTNPIISEEAKDMILGKFI